MVVVPKLSTSLTLIEAAAQMESHAQVALAQQARAEGEGVEFAIAGKRATFLVSFPTVSEARGKVRNTPRGWGGRQLRRESCHRLEG